MSDVVSDYFEGEISIDESLNTGVPERMGTRTRYLDARAAQIVSGSGRDRRVTDG